MTPEVLSALGMVMSEIIHALQSHDPERKLRRAAMALASERLADEAIKRELLELKK